MEAGLARWDYPTLFDAGIVDKCSEQELAALILRSLLHGQ